MDSLVAKIVSETGVPEDDARKIIELVVHNMKTYLPESVGGMLDVFLSGEEVGNAALGIAKGLVGGFFGFKNAG
jgi:hypothetical protein